MATLTVTIAAGAQPGEVLRRAAKALEQAVVQIPDSTTTGASTVLTIDNAPSAGAVSFQITAGPYQGSVFRA